MKIKLEWIINKTVRWLSPSVRPLASMCMELSKGLMLIAFGYLYFKDPTNTESNSV